MTTDRLIALVTVLSLMVVTLLALKSRFLNRRLLALAQQFRLHHLLALFAGAGMLIHVALAFYRDWPESLGLYLTLTDWVILCGWGALLCFAIVIATSWLSRLKWKHWYLLHLMTIPAFVLTALHALVLARTRRFDMAILIFLFAAIMLILLRAFYDRLTGAHAEKFYLKSLNRVAEGVYEMHLETVTLNKTKQVYPAGTIVYVRFLSAGFSRAWHPFSVASCRYESDMRLLIKGLGHDTAHLDDLAANAHVLIRGPYREFTPDFSRPQIWIAGGIGIAPFAGYAACLAHYPHGRVTLFHFFEREEQKLPLKPYAGAPPNGFAEVPLLTQPRTLPDLHAVIAAAAENPKAQFIVCGPPRFMRYIRHALNRAGVDGANIETEEFLPW